MAREEPVSPRPRPGVGESAKSNRDNQRERLLRAVVERAAGGGYPSARIGDIAAHAGVSRATFYELFENKEECFLAAHRELADRLGAVTATSVAAADPERAIDAAFRAVVDYAREEPLAYAFVTHEAMLAGPRALQQRDHLLAQIAETVQRAYDTHSAALPPDLPVGILLGGLIRVLGMRMRRGPYDSDQLLAELLAWVDCYRVAGRTGHRPIRFPSKGSGIERMPPGALAPAPLPRGRHRLPTALVTRVQRERILHATADVIHTKGYEDTTVADIVGRAGISREVFYSHFHSRSDAFLATHTLVFEQLMATAAGAFIASAGSWPERVWDSWGAATALVVGSPSLAHFAFVESYALGSSVSRRTDEAVLAFTVFLRDGHRYMEQATEPSAAMIPAAIAGAVMETSAAYIRRDQAGELFALLPTMVYMILSPFLGAEPASKFIKSKLRER